MESQEACAGSGPSSAALPPAATAQPVRHPAAGFAAAEGSAADCDHTDQLPAVVSTHARDTWLFSRKRVAMQFICEGHECLPSVYDDMVVKILAALGFPLLLCHYTSLVSPWSRCWKEG